MSFRIQRHSFKRLVVSWIGHVRLHFGGISLCLTRCLYSLVEPIRNRKVISPIRRHTMLNHISDVYLEHFKGSQIVCDSPATAHVECYDCLIEDLTLITQRSKSTNKVNQYYVSRMVRGFIKHRPLKATPLLTRPCGTLHYILHSALPAYILVGRQKFSHIFARDVLRGPLCWPCLDSIILCRAVGFRCVRHRSEDAGSVGIFLLQGMDLRFEISDLALYGSFRFLALGRERIQAICDFLSNADNSGIEAIHDRLEPGKPLLTLGASQVTFEGLGLNFSLGPCLNHFYVRRYVGQLEGKGVDKSKGGRILLSKDVWRTIGLPFVGASIRYVLSTGIGNGTCGFDSQSVLQPHCGH